MLGGVTCELALCRVTMGPWLVQGLTLDSRLLIAVLGLALLDSLNPMLFAGEL